MFLNRTDFAAPILRRKEIQVWQSTLARFHGLIARLNAPEARRLRKRWPEARARDLATLAAIRPGLRGVGRARMYRLVWAAATLFLMALSFAAGRMTLEARIMPEIVATLPNDEIAILSRTRRATSRALPDRHEPGQADRLSRRVKLCSGLASTRRERQRVYFQRLDVRQGRSRGLASRRRGEPYPCGRLLRKPLFVSGMVRFGRCDEFGAVFAKLRPARNSITLGSCRPETEVRRDCLDVAYRRLADISACDGARHSLGESGRSNCPCRFALPLTPRHQERNEQHLIGTDARYFTSLSFRE